MAGRPAEAIGEAVEKAFGDAVREQNLRVAGYPRIEPKGGEDAPGWSSPRCSRFTRR
jgi:FKBP-type peptidyl-prolyl cis-trans isomerase (trigger factor)